MPYVKHLPTSDVEDVLDAWQAPDVPLTEIKDRLRAALNFSGLTQYALARQLEVDQSTVTRWLKGDRGNIEARAFDIAEATGVDARWLAKGGPFMAKGVPEPLNKPEEECSLIEIIRLYPRRWSAMQIAEAANEVFGDRFPDGGWSNLLDRKRVAPTAKKVPLRVAGGGKR